MTSDHQQIHARLFTHGFPSSPVWAWPNPPPHSQFCSFPSSNAAWEVSSGRLSRVFTTAGLFLTGCVQDGESELIPRRVGINGNQERLARSSVVITHAIGSDSTGMWLISPWLYQHSIRGL